MGDLVIGDISGYKKEFEKLIQGFAGRIIALGDIIDRGPESRQMIEFFMNHPEHLTLMGNHEHMMIKTYEEVMDNKKSPYFSLIWIYVNGGKETLESYGITVPSPPFDLNEMFRMNKQDRMKLLDLPEIKAMLSEFNLIPRSHIEFLKSLPLFLETDKAFLSHAPIKNWKEPKLFQYLAFDGNDYLLDHGCLWNRTVYDKKRADGKIFIYGHENKKRALVHTDRCPAGIYLKELDVIPPDVWGICVDTVKAGYLTGFDLSDLSIRHQVIE